MGYITSVDILAAVTLPDRELVGKIEAAEFAEAVRLGAAPRGSLTAPGLVTEASLVGSGVLVDQSTPSVMCLGGSD